MAKFVVVGAGPVGRCVTDLLRREEHEVSVITRHGGALDDPRVTRVALDATNVKELSALAAGSAAIFNCANPPYHRWLVDWPPLAHSLLVAAERSGAVLTTLSNLYAYGPPTGPMSSDTPLLATYAKAQVRATMWHDALTAHENSRLRATEVRASDFIGPDARSALGAATVRRLLAGKTCWVVGASDQLHSWTYTKDVARTLVTCATTPEAWGHAWHTPTNAPRTQQQVIDDLADAAGRRRVRVSVVPKFALRLAGAASPLARELPLTMYQFTSPFIIDDEATRRTLGLAPTPWTDVLNDAIAASR